MISIFHLALYPFQIMVLVIACPFRFFLQWQRCVFPRLHAKLQLELKNRKATPQEQVEAEAILAECMREADEELLEEAPEDVLEGEQVQEQQQEAEQEGDRDSVDPQFVVEEWHSVNIPDYRHQRYRSKSTDQQKESVEVCKHENRRLPPFDGNFQLGSSGARAGAGAGTRTGGGLKVGVCSCLLEIFAVLKNYILWR